MIKIQRGLDTWIVTLSNIVLGIPHEQRMCVLDGLLDRGIAFGMDADKDLTYIYISSCQVLFCKAVGSLDPDKALQSFLDLHIPLLTKYCLHGEMAEDVMQMFTQRSQFHRPSGELRM